MGVVLTVETTTQRSVVVRPVRCTYCQRDYVYRDELISKAQSFGVYGYGHSDVRDKLAKDQKEKRKEEFTPIPCPRCFRYPEYMAEHLRTERVARRFSSGCVYLLGTLFVAGLAWLIGTNPEWGPIAITLWVAAGILAALMLGHSIAWYLSLTNYQPNDNRYLADRRDEAEDSAMTREEFEGMLRAVAEKSLADRLVTGRERPGYAQTPIQVPVWLGYCTDRDWRKRAPLPATVLVSLPNGEEYPLDLPDDLREFDEFNVKRTVDGVRVVFRCVIRFYHPTRRAN